MVEGSEGDIKIGERLRRIETRLDSIENQFGERITRHKEANVEAVEKLADYIVQNVGQRLVALETSDKVDKAAAKALSDAKKEAKSNKRWVIGSALTLGGLLVTVLGLLWAMFDKVA